MKKKMPVFNILFAIVFFWGILTMVVQQSGSVKQFSYKTDNSTQKALVVYSPDPFYNFDEQISRGFAEGLVEKGWSVELWSVKAAKDFKAEDFDLIGLCANTYNWSPDWGVTHFMEEHDQLEGMKMVAITVGSGSTARAKRILEEKVKERNGVLVRSETYWLNRPNDEERTEESNVGVGVEQARELGVEVGDFFKEGYSLEE